MKSVEISKMSCSNHTNSNGVGNVTNFDVSQASLYKQEAIECTTFKTIYCDLNDGNDNEEINSFKPLMAHQIFGETESIFGYRDLKINIYYTHNSAQCCVQIGYTNKLDEYVKCKPDNIIALLNPWLPTNYCTDLTQFKEVVKKEEHDLIYGTVVDTIPSEKSVFFHEQHTCEYIVTECNTENKDFKAFHERFETFIIWFIDGANFIDLDDSKWMIFYLYEEVKTAKNDITYRTPIGFCTAYKFYHYPNGHRPRISQFFILPSHQKRGFGTKFYSSVFNHLKNIENVHDITIEEPTDILQKLRDFADCSLLYQDFQQNNINIGTLAPKHFHIYLQKHKICKRQGQRVFDILHYFAALQNEQGELSGCISKMKERFTIAMKKNWERSKRHCTMNRDEECNALVDRDSAIEYEFNKYMESIQSPFNRLKKTFM